MGPSGTQITTFASSVNEEVATTTNIRNMRARGLKPGAGPCCSLSGRPNTRATTGVFSGRAPQSATSDNCRPKAANSAYFVRYTHNGHKVTCFGIILNELLFEIPIIDFWINLFYYWYNHWNPCCYNSNRWRISIFLLLLRFSGFSYRFSSLEITNSQKSEIYIF